MDFLEELRRYLRQPVSVPAGDQEAHRRHFLSTLQRCESEGRDPAWIEEQFNRLGPHLETFTRVLARKLAAAGITTDRFPWLIEVGISMTLGVAPSRLPTPARLVLEDAIGRLESPMYGWRDVAAYAREIRAVPEHGDRVEITPIGRACLDLVGVQTVRWLLHVEVALSTGGSDPWRVDLGSIDTLVRAPSQSWNPFDPVVEPPLSHATLHRLAAFGVLTLHVLDPSDHEPIGYHVAAHATQLLEELAARDSPMAIAVAALLSDQQAGSLPSPAGDTATAAVVARQARLVIHEVRNALLPVRTAVGEIYRVARSVGAEDRIDRERGMVDRGIARVLELADDLGESMRLAGETPDAFSAMPAIRDAARAVEQEFQRAPRLALPDTLPGLYGVRHRFVLALVNVLRNAYQAAPAGTPEVALNAAVENARVWIAVDDSGPGVPDDRRDRVFANGYSARDGGTGHGLALARQIIEDDMRGTLTCEDGSALGGARFVITLPPHDGRTP